MILKILAIAGVAVGVAIVIIFCWIVAGALYDVLHTEMKGGRNEQ